jgi:hypothetical protein
MNHRTLIALVGVLTLPAVALPKVTAAAERQAPGTWTGVSRVIAVGDLHGSYDKAVRLLQAADLLDEDLRWIGGAQHLVVVGDFVDRGVGDRALMDLFRRIQTESEAVGGRVHVLLGNHEVMVLMRDHRYVNAESYRAWADEEKEADRRAAWRIFSRSAAGNADEDSTRSEFEKKFPPGYFARQKSLDRDGAYGRWLLGLPTTVKINGVVFVHGGLTVATAALGVDEINRQIQALLRRHVEAREALEEKGVVTPLMTFVEIFLMAQDGVARANRLSRPLREAAQELYESARSPLLGEEGPLWYRGGSIEDERIEGDMVARTLELMDARAIVVAHSPTPSKRITSRFHGQLYRVDHNISRSENLQALVVESEEIMVLDAANGRTQQAESELPIGRFDPRAAAEVPDSVLQEFLTKAEIVDSRYLGRGTTRPRLLELKMGGQRRRGIFKTVENGENPSPGEAADRFQHEVAAYLLDRELDLNMVPVTVIRKIDGERGSLQSWVEGAIDQEEAEAYDLELFDTDAMARQLDTGEIFDALIGNFDRGPNDHLCPVNRQRLLLIDHSRAFSTSSELTGEDGKSLAVDPQLRAALRGLDRESLDGLLGDLISDRQIEALLLRRDKILDRLSMASADTAAQP